MRHVETHHFHTMFSLSLWTVLALFLVLVTVVSALTVNAWLNARRRRQRR